MLRIIFLEFEAQAAVLKENTHLAKIIRCQLFTNKGWWQDRTDVLWASVKSNYSSAEESDGVNVFNCYPLQSFCNNNKQMKLQLSRQQQQKPPLRHQDSDLWLLTSRKRSQTPAQGWSLRWSGRKLDHQHRTGDQKLKDTNWVCQTNWWIDTRCLGYLHHNTQPCHRHSFSRWNTFIL